MKIAKNRQRDLHIGKRVDMDTGKAEAGRMEVMQLSHGSVVSGQLGNSQRKKKRKKEKRVQLCLPWSSLV
jgi:hypothetical protein